MPRETEKDDVAAWCARFDNTHAEGYLAALLDGSLSLDALRAAVAQGVSIEAAKVEAQARPWIVIDQAFHLGVFGPFADENTAEAFAAKLGHDDYSVEELLDPVAHDALTALWADAEPWSAEEAKQIANMARGALDHRGSPKGRTSRRADGSLRIKGCGGPEFCGACALVDYEPGVRAPNYAGWARVYVEAGLPIGERELREELARTGNDRYVNALRRSCKTFGVVLR